jgi:hypothetical protein
VKGTTANTLTEIEAAAHHPSSPHDMDARMNFEIHLQRYGRLSHEVGKTLSKIRKAIDERPLLVALNGGSTPTRLFQLATEYRDKIA